jgi:hypothetical protein
MAGASRLVATITNNNGRLSSAGPITLKNQIQEIRSIENILDVNVVEAANGATLIYNSQNDKYEVRQLSFADLAVDLDGGSF